MVTVKTEEEIGLMRESCRIVAEVLNLVGSYIKPGMTTARLDAIVEEYIRSHGGEPAFKGYTPDGSTPFPATICVSIDEEVVHGIPGKRVLSEGEIVSIDVGVRTWNCDSFLTLLTLTSTSPTARSRVIRLSSTLSEAM